MAYVSSVVEVSGTFPLKAYYCFVFSYFTSVILFFNVYACFFFFFSVMNGEKAAYGSPTFSNRRQRTLDSLITRLLQDHMHEVSTGYG